MMGIPICDGTEQENSAVANFVVENMTCGGCAKGVTATLKHADPAAHVEVRLDSKEVAVSGGRADSAALLRALEADGWKACAVT